MSSNLSEMSRKRSRTEDDKSVDAGADGEEDAEGDEGKAMKGGDPGTPVLASKEEEEEVEAYAGVVLPENSTPENSPPARGRKEAMSHINSPQEERESGDYHSVAAAAAPPEHGPPPHVPHPSPTARRGHQHAPHPPPPIPPQFGYYPPHGHPGYPPPAHLGPPPHGEMGYPPPPHRGYEGYPPPGYGPPGYYMPPPPYMYPPYQHPMYGPPPPHPHAAPHHPHYPPPPHYADPNMAPHPPPMRYPEEGMPPGATPYGPHPTHASMPPHMRGPPPAHMGHPPQAMEDDRKGAARASADSSRTGTEADDDDGTGDDDEDGSSSAVTARLKTYIKPRNPTTQDVLDRRSRKNMQSRSRATKLRQRILEIELKPESERTEEELHIWEQYENRRQRKNDRSRERALEKKEEIDRILAKPEKKRTKIEKQFLDSALGAKKRKNEGDRLRRQRLKDLGISTKGSGMKPGISARGPLPPQYQHAVHSSRGSHQHVYPHMHGMPSHSMHDIPMSPLPMPHHHGGMASPGGFGSPGMMQFPSPSRGRAPHATPVRHGGSMPYMPAPQAYDSQHSPSSGAHHPHQPPGGLHASRVEQRRNPDGSMSISIGGHGGTGPSFGGEARMPGSGDEQVHMNEVSGLLLDNENGYNDDDQEGEDQDEKSE